MSVRVGQAEGKKKPFAPGLPVDMQIVFRPGVPHVHSLDLPQVTRYVLETPRYGGKTVRITYAGGLELELDGETIGYILIDTGERNEEAG